ncbi:MAG TPA: ELWxxDGT repeat protein [Flavipsychrobacter sp.]|nr:ELWxxDGT repeat protein [Flavipsychrobacter sp.]
MKKIFILILVLCFCISDNAFTQLPTLLANLNPAGNSNPGTFTLANGKLFFRAQDGTHGFELFVADGTVAGSKMVKDINPGSASSLPDFMASYSGKLYFQADDGTYGAELWSSDGTSVGTQMVKDIYPGSLGSSPYIPTVFNDKLYFQASDTVNTQALWVTDGTSSGTMIVTPVISVTNLTVMNNLLFMNGSDTAHGSELWVTDGTTGPKLLKDISPGKGSGNPNSMAACNNKLFFSANDGTNGYELWVSDGTAAGTKLVKDINPGASSYPGNFIAYGGLTYFVADDGTHGRELWVTDGTDAGTHLLKDINPGSNNFTIGSDIGIMQLGSKLYFGAEDVTGGAQLWSTDGTATGTVMVKNISPYSTGGVAPLDMHLYHDKLYFYAVDSLNGAELWVTDGTDTGTKIILPAVAPNHDPLQLSPVPGAIIVYNDNLYWAANYDTSGQEVYMLHTPPTTGISTIINNDDFVIYPNPANDMLMVKIKAGDYDQLQILNTSGQTMTKQSVQSNETRLRIDQLPPGIYSILLHGTNSVQVKRFQKL